MSLRSHLVACLLNMCGLKLCYTSSR
ncbi:hypothetical protein GBAR_LOCUS16527 [Geodia barretti]|uniref:Uncharacterized protein n=1 Tax=Geodia barretti TaxID=519541 RepID=A0AA35SI16_GEOBA|nr:hypothetical protein GBAR_LOCUS16527 [Geodia barretti]